MPNASKKLTVAQQESIADEIVLDMLLDIEWQRPWSVEEIARELGDPVEADDCLGRLIRRGLVHQLNGYVFASRAAIHAIRIARHVGSEPA
ncbi:MAG: hypothetical protein WB698_05490 [Solirubrobacteraceae bacterium]